MSACTTSSNNPLPAASEDAAAPPNEDGAAPAVDSGGDVAVSVPFDAGQDSSPGNADAGDASDAALPCAPISVAAFVPPAYVPASGAFQLACQTTPQLTAEQALYAPCFGDAGTGATCDGFDGGAGESCVTCIRTHETDTAYGPVVERVVPTINLAGCIQLADPTDAGVGCAHAVQAAEACVEAACKSVCPVTDLASQGAYLACASAAAAGGCATYATAAASCAAAELGDGGTGPAGPRCFGVDEPSEYANVALYFCGS
jgi:hypothetical protein